MGNELIKALFLLSITQNGNNTKTRQMTTTDEIKIQHNIFKHVFRTTSFIACSFINYKTEVVQKCIRDSKFAHEFYGSLISTM